MTERKKVNKGKESRREGGREGEGEDYGEREIWSLRKFLPKIGFE